MLIEECSSAECSGRLNEVYGSRLLIISHEEVTISSVLIPWWIPRPGWVGLDVKRAQAGRVCIHGLDCLVSHGHDILNHMLFNVLAWCMLGCGLPCQ